MKADNTPDNILKQKIDNLDLSLIVNRLVKKYNWNKNDALECEELYRNFLFLMAKYQTKEILVPTEEIDLFWHEHILHTKKYMNDCNEIFGKYKHHSPSDSDVVKDSNGNEVTVAQLFENTQELHLKEFGCYMHDIKLTFNHLVKYFFKKIFKK